MFGDNQEIVPNSSIPHFSLNKRNIVLAYHCVCKIIATKTLGYYWMDGKKDQADNLIKHWSYPKVWHPLKPLLIYSGDSRI
jgi:hypothetical protein